MVTRLLSLSHIGACADVSASGRDMPQLTDICLHQRTVLTTLHVGSVLLTFYPNFTLSLEDPNLPTTIKVQIQLQGAYQTPTSKLATLHHQIVYQLQNHALDLPTPYTTSDALMILADTNTIPTIIQIPKQIQKQELLKLMPLEWLTNYEHFHQNSEPVQATEATFERRQNGQVKLSFQTLKPQPVSVTPRLSYTGQSYKESFPPLEKQTDTQTRVFSKPFVQSPVTASGQLEEPKQYEAVLNWQTKNANAQNQTLKQLEKRIDRVASQVSQTKIKVDSISHRLD
ncbi:hypothetical protein KPL70_007564 [Citrus sinensis]|nr:hypothetical protein KPL70_007564 [Citrus sinensis]